MGDKILRLLGSFAGAASGVVVAIIGIVIFGVPSLLLILLAYWLLLGRIGLLKKAFRLAGAEKARTDTRDETKNNGN